MPKSSEENKKDKINILLSEYQKAQDSAEHHDNLVWTVSSIIIAGMLVLIGLSLDNLANQSLRFLISSIAIFGIILSIFLWKFKYSFKIIKNQKYARCKEIEKNLEMKQHRESKYSERVQTKFYRIILILFILIWIIILLKVLGINICAT